MTIGYSNSNKNLNAIAFRAETPKGSVLTKPIEQVQTIIESGVDKFIPQDDKKKKKRRKRAIAAASTVVVIGTLTMLLNPKNSSRLTAKLKTLQKDLDVKIKHSKDDFLKSKMYSLYKKTLSGIEKAGNIYFNLNSGKDVIFDSMCTNKNKKYPEFLTKNKTIHSIVKFFDHGFVKIFEKPHKAITKWFDSISKSTVQSKYKKTLKKMDAFEKLLEMNKDKLPSTERAKVEALLKQIAEVKESFADDAVLKRLKDQESLMAGLKDNIWNRIYNKQDGLAKNSTEFWALKALEEKKLGVEQKGAELMEKLFGSNGKKGLYNELMDIYHGSIDLDTKNVLYGKLAKLSKTARKANFSECSEYFDKKRDLILGGAPTDIVTQLFGLGLCGWAVSRAEKGERGSKAFTTGVPVAVGLGSALWASAKLYSGGVGLLFGAVTSAVADITCGLINKHVFGNKDDDDETDRNKLVADNKVNKNQEVKNA